MFLLVLASRCRSLSRAGRPACHHTKSYACAMRVWERRRRSQSHFVRTYAVGVLCLRQSGTFLFKVCGFSARSAEKPHTVRIGKYHAAAGEYAALGCITAQLRNSDLFWLHVAALPPHAAKK